MKRFLLHIILLFVPVLAFADADTWVVLRMKGGMTQAYLVPGRMIVKADADSIRLTSEKMEVAYSKQMVEGYFFQRDDDMPTEIEAVAEKGITVEYLAEDKILIKGIATNTAVKVYGINGIEYKNSSSHFGDAVVISLKSLPRGTYIIQLKNIGAIKIKR